MIDELLSASFIHNYILLVLYSMYSAIAYTSLVWDMSHNPQYFDDPLNFKPSRFEVGQKCIIQYNMQTNTILCTNNFSLSQIQLFCLEELFLK